MTNDQLRDLIITVRQAYQLTRKEPRGGRYRQTHDGRDCRCAVGVLHDAFARGTESLWDTFHRLTGADANQRHDFELGFDSAFKPQPLYESYAPLQTAWWRAGREVGLAVRPHLKSPSKEDAS